MIGITYQGWCAVSHSHRRPQIEFTQNQCFPQALWRKVPVSRNTSAPDEKEFFPVGAIAFFISMILAYGVIWLGIYVLLLHRHVGL